MKSKMISVWAVLLLGTSPVWAQKYHDAIVEDSHGPVKMIKSDGKIFSYDSDGRLTTVDHEDAPDTKYDNNGYPLEGAATCVRNMNIMKTGSSPRKAMRLYWV